MGQPLIILSCFRVFGKIEAIYLIVIYSWGLSH
jgi:hypothetical protein